MSMNLHADTIDLWQTPTWLTIVSLKKESGKSRKWTDTRFIYAEWVKGKLNGCWDNDDEYFAMKGRVESHLEELYNLKKINFQMM